MIDLYILWFKTNVQEINKGPRHTKKLKSSWSPGKVNAHKKKQNTHIHKLLIY